MVPKWCHSRAIDLRPYVESLRSELAHAAEAGGDESRALAERLARPLESAVRLALLDALSDAAEEITRELAPGSVELRLRGREPEFVVAAPPAEEVYAPEPAAPTLPPVVSDGGDEGAMTRINLRLPEQLKGRVEAAAGRAGLSVNAWLVRAAAAGLGEQQPSAVRRASVGGDRFEGWVG